jgi:hypothetical protein
MYRKSPARRCSATVELHWCSIQEHFLLELSACPARKGLWAEQ